MSLLRYHHEAQPDFIISVIIIIIIIDIPSVQLIIIMGFLDRPTTPSPHILIVATFDLPPPPHHLLPNSSVVLDRTYVLGDEPTNERTDVPCPAHDFYVIPRFDLLRLFGLVVHVTQSSSSSAMNVLAGGRTTIYAHCHGGPGYMAWQWIKNRVGLPPHHHSRPNAGDPFVCSRN